LYDWLRQVRRDIHRHPEVAMKEHRTTAKIKAILAELKIDIMDLPELEVGAVGIIRGRPGDKTLALRADIDALPIDESNEVPYKSTIPGVMHACGHDANTTIVLGVAKNVVESGLAERITGNLKLIFQPAEEIFAGAKALIKAGVLDNPSVTRILACHVWPDLHTGQIGLYNGYSHANSDSFRLLISGHGGHGCRPDLTDDPIVAGINFVSSIQTIVSRNVSPMDTSVISVGIFNAGTAPNIIPGEALIEGTVRTFTTASRDLVRARMEEITQGLEKSFRVTNNWQYILGVPAVYNQESVSDDLYAAAVRVLGEENVSYLQPATGGEDFALYTQKVPGSFMRVGCADASRGIDSPVHTSDFDLDEGSLAVGVDVLTEEIRTYLA